MSAPPITRLLLSGPRPGWSEDTLELALISRLRLMGLGLAIWPSHTDVLPMPALAWHSWLICWTMLLRLPARL